MKRMNIVVVGVAMAMASASAAICGDLTGAAAGDARTKVATAVALANIAKAEKDGEALLVATKILATAGPVALPGGEVRDGKPALYDIAALAADAKALGADAGKADAVAKLASPTGARSDGYWYYSCDSFNNCQWIYAGW